MGGFAQDLRQHGVLGVEVEVEAGAGHTGAVADRADRQFGERLLFEQLADRLHDGVPLLVAPATGRLDGFLLRGHPLTLHHAGAKMKLDMRQDEWRGWCMTPSVHPPAPRSVDADHQYPPISAGPGAAANHHVTMLTLPGMGLVEKRLLARDWPQHVMAQPPAGSGLKPVMGDSGLPISATWSRCSAAARTSGCISTASRGPCTTPRSPAFAGGRAGPRRDSGDLLQPQQGLLAAGLDSHDRGVLQPRPDAARLRRAHVPPADHAGGVHPHPAVRLHRARRQGRLARSSPTTGWPTIRASCSIRR